MSTTADISTPPEIVYPDSDGQPMADNTLQIEWIVTIKGGLEALFWDNPDVFVAGDLLWYPVEGDPAIRTAPDVLVAFGRSKGYRGSYQQWREGNVAPQVVFEVLSPGKGFCEALRKFLFYQRYGVNECYLYDPNHGDLTGYLRSGSVLTEIPVLAGWISPRLGIRFEFERGELQIYRPDGRNFATYVELEKQREAAQAQADEERRKREAAQAHVARLADQLPALGINPEP